MEVVSEVNPADSNNYYGFSFRSSLYVDNNGGISSTPSTLFNSEIVDYDIDGTGENGSVQDAFVEGSHLWSLLVVGYSIVFVIGVVANTVLLAALCGTGSRARALPVRNHLMISLAAADLLVTGVCVPISACAAASHSCWPSQIVDIMCQLGPSLQRTPVAASTLSLALLSLDRWAAIRHPRFAQRFRERRFVAMSMALIWIVATLVAAPTFWARQWDEHSPMSLWSEEKEMEEHTDDDVGLRNNSSSGFGMDQSWGDKSSGVCVERWTNIGVQLTYSATYLGTTFVSPALIVAACHASVSYKLTAQLKVLSGATSGDRFNSRPRPKQVLIVARDPSNNIIPNPLNPPVNNPRGLGARHGSTSRSGSLDGPSGRPSRKFIPCDPNSDDEDVLVRMQIHADLESLRQMSEYQQSLAKSAEGSRRGIKSLTTFRSEASVSKTDNNNMLKASKRETSIIRAHRRLRNKLNVPVGAPLTAKMPPAPLLSTYSSSSQSFRSRKRAANLLGALAAVFAFCWLPYVVCALLEMFLKEKSLVRLVIPFSLFLGHAHSAINPVVSYRLNRSAFVRFQRQSIFSFLPEWLRALSTCRLFCYSCTCPPLICCDKPSECGHSHPTTSPVQTGSHRPPPFRRAGTRYPGINENHRNPFLHSSPLRGNQRGGGGRNLNGNPGSSPCCICGSIGDETTDDAVPCCCCFCPSGMFARRSSSPDLWNRNTSTNEAALGAFHPKYLTRLPVQDPISRCHTSHFLR
ncbi:uncharacterized protein LOC118433842 [Folsomia candida]|uniref:uncharacterized protein LOC118433842 n=1 Tax=Folsomia candida TaxID=158441 RepID=UPI001605202A|nr:uncharacterized protein LOC118433842 [Folsomia candida]